MSDAPLPAGPARRRLAARARTIGLPVVLIAATALFLSVTTRHYPIAQWLFWRYAAYWLLCALFAVACLASGHRLLRWILPVPLPLGEHLLLASALGCYTFFAALFVAGIFGLYGTVTFWAIPVLLVAMGARPLVREMRRAAYHLGRARRRRRAATSPWSYLWLACGVLALAIVYGGILVPDAVAYDARWNHLAVAEHYAALGGIGPFVEGWYLGAYPHLASVLYTWAFLLPRSLLFDRVELAMHLEFTLFLATLAGIPLVVRRLVPGTRAAFSWVVLFLFPGVFLYDSSLTGASDHVTAFWALPIVLLLLRALPRLGPRECVLLGLMLSGALLTKYQAVYLLAGPAVALAVRTLQLVVRTRRAGWLAGPALCLAVGVLATAPHWLTNWIYYRDPLYPYLHLTRTLPLQVDAGWVPVGTASQKALETARAMATFSFIPHDWAHFHGTVPVFGSLFTLALLAVPFLRGTHRIWGLVAMTQLGVLIWYTTFHQDRYLQILLPWMVAATSAIFILVWSTGLASRVALGALIAVQAIWAGDIPFLPTHAMMRDTPLKRSIELLSAGYRKQYERRFACLYPFSDIGNRLPPKSKVLVHDVHTKLGLGAMTVSDAAGWQGELDYARLKTPHALYERLRGWGVTHLLWDANREPSHGLQEDLLFYSLAMRSATRAFTVGSTSVSPMPPVWQDDPLSIVVLQVGCGGRAPGLYRIDDLEHATRALAPGEQPAALLASAGAVVIDEACGRSPLPGLARELTLAAHHGARALWIRRAR